jgi:hypothetical protein
MTNDQAIALIDEILGQALALKAVFMRRRGAGPSVPDQVLGLTATPVSSSQISLSWNAAATAQTYTIRRDGQQIVNLLAATTYPDIGLSASTLYRYTVAAVNTFGEGMASAIVGATTAAGSNVFPPSAPTITNLTATGTADPTTTLRATHTSVVSTDHYAVQTRTTGAIPWNRLTAFDHTGTVIDITGNSPGQSLDVRIAACDLTESVVLWSATATAVTQAASGTSLPNPSYALYLIGDSSTSTFRYDNSPYQQYAQLFDWHIMNPLSNHDGAATQTLPAICSTIRSGALATENFFYFDPFFIFSYYETNFFNAFLNSNWFLKSPSYLTGAVVHPGGNSTQYCGNICPGGPTGPGGRTCDQYVADYEVGLRITGNPAGLVSGTALANTRVKGFYYDDMSPGVNFSGGQSVTGDFQRIGGTNDYSYPGSGSSANVLIRQGVVAIMDRMQANSPYPIVVGGNGGGSGYNNAQPLPPEYVGKWGLVLYENAQGGGSGSPSNPGNGGSFENMLASYQRKTLMGKTSGIVYGLFGGSNVRADGSAMVEGPPNNAIKWSPAWQGVRYQWGCNAIGGNFSYFPAATDPANSGGQGAPYSSTASLLRYFDWFKVNIASSQAYTQAQARSGLGANWIGAWIDPPQTVKWASIGPKGIWRRQGTNADVFLCPYGNGAQTNVPLGRSYRKITSAQDPTMNGGTTTNWNFGDGDCFIGLK